MMSTRVQRKIEIIVFVFLVEQFVFVPHQLLPDVCVNVEICTSGLQRENDPMK